MAQSSRRRRAKNSNRPINQPVALGSTAENVAEIPEKVFGVETAAFAGLAATVYVAYRVLAVSRWNTTTALAIIDKAGTGSVLIGILTTAVPVFLVPLCLGAYWQWLRSNKKSKIWSFLADLFLFLALYGSPVALVIGAAAFVALRFISSSVRSLAWIGSLLSFERSDGSIVIASLLVLTVFANPAMWLPPQELSVTQGKSTESVTGYVLVDDNDTVEYLDEETRLIMRVAANKVADRSYCQFSSHSSWLQSPALSALVFHHGSDYRVCSANSN